MADDLRLKKKFFDILEENKKREKEKATVATRASGKPKAAVR